MNKRNRTIRLIESSLYRLRIDAAPALPVHGNTKLTGDQLVLGLLLAFFDPRVRSLRLIEIPDDRAGTAMLFGVKSL
jgi:hypothetical protein